MYRTTPICLGRISDPATVDVQNYGLYRSGMHRSMGYKCVRDIVGDAYFSAGISANANQATLT